MNVAELKALIANVPDETPVVVACENRCDPHPVQSGYSIGAYEDDDEKRFPHVVLYQDDRVDFQRVEWKDV